MAGHGSFDKIAGPARAVHLSYWQANGLGQGGAVKVIEESDDLVAAMVALVQRMIAHFAKPSTPYEALVCIFLNGGNDGHNLVVPIATAQQNYSLYQQGQRPAIDDSDPCRFATQ